MRILIFEDTYDILEIISNFKINTEKFVVKQYWNTKDSIKKIKQFNPDVLLLDYFIEPLTGLQVFQELNLAIKKNQVSRPNKVIGISSSPNANSKFLQAGLDDSIIKFELDKLDIWQGYKL
jgi:two-component system phosphate regulon response regulator PhoB